MVQTGYHTQEKVLDYQIIISGDKRVHYCCMHNALHMYALSDYQIMISADKWMHFLHTCINFQIIRLSGYDIS